VRLVSLSQPGPFGVEASRESHTVLAGSPRHGVTDGRISPFRFCASAAKPSFASLLVLRSARRPALQLQL
jgi:hypothetical protein